MSLDSKSDEQKSDNISEYNPKLDFFSELFDPLLALSTPNVKVPVPNAKLYDNLAMYKSAEDKRNIQNQQPEAKKDINQKKSVKDQPTYERRWLPHQLPIQTTRTVPENKNIFAKMEAMEGPMKLLWACKDNHWRIKVWTRHSHNIRGYCIGYLTVFDKHLNLALEDVEEIWTRRRKLKVPAFDQLNCDKKIKPNIHIPKIEIIKMDKKTETCRRQMDQIMVRGEQIALIAVIKETAAAT